MAETPFLKIAELCRSLESTTKRNQKITIMADFLKQLSPNEIRPAVSMMLGKIFAEREKAPLEVGVRTLAKVIDGAGQLPLVRTPLTVSGVHGYFRQMAKISGEGSGLRRESLLDSLLTQATPLEREYMVRMILGEMRIGASTGLVLEAIGKAGGADLELVRRAHLTLGDVGLLAEIALREGRGALEEMDLQLFNPVRPMLAEMAYDFDEVFRSHGRTAFEFKFDGARIQIHRRLNDFRIFSRRLSDVTRSLPDVIGLASKSLPQRDYIVEGEVVALSRDGRPLPFQDLMRRFRRAHGIEAMVKEIPLRLYLFDLLYLDGKALVDRPYSERWNLLSSICPADLLAERLVTDQAGEAGSFLRRAVGAGHEGLVAKSLESRYTPGMRGKLWFKIKPADRLDLVVIAAEWGSGRRRGWLSNYHLGAWDEGSAQFLSVGKTFKGLTDAEFEEMTERLKGLKVAEDDYTVYVKPEVVVEVAYNEIQRSPHYKSGFALRFARISRIRYDKPAGQADALARISELYEKQFLHKGRMEP